LHHCDKISDINNLREEKIYFGLWFQRLQSTVFGSSHYGPLVRQNIMAEQHEAEAVYLIMNRKQRKRKELGTRYNLHSCAPVTPFPPVRPYLPNFHQKKSVNIWRLK
jgi:hypothetical protein